MEDRRGSGGHDQTIEYDKELYLRVKALLHSELKDIEWDAWCTRRNDIGSEISKARDVVQNQRLENIREREAERTRTQTLFRRNDDKTAEALRRDALRQEVQRHEAKRQETRDRKFQNQEAKFAEIRSRVILKTRGTRQEKKG